MKIEVNIDKKYFFILLSTILLIGAGIFVYAYGDFSSGDPKIMGHSSDELMVKIGAIERTLQQAIDNKLLGNFDFSVAGVEITNKPNINDDPRDDVTVTADSTVIGAVLAFNKVKGQCKDIMADLYTFEDKQLGSIWSWVQEGASYDEGDYVIVPLTDGKFKITKILGQQKNGKTCPSNEYIIRKIAYIR